MQITVVTRSVSFYLVALLLPLFAFLTSCSENEGGVGLSLGKHTSDYWGRSAWQLENMRKPKKTYKCLLRDRVWQTEGRDAKRGSPLILPHVAPLPLTLDFIIVYKTAIISVSPLELSRSILRVIPLKSWVENIWQMPAWSFPPN